jgi:hypothetical protein
MSHEPGHTRPSRTGYHPFAPTKEQRDQVEAMAGYGIPHEDICRLVINPRTGCPIDDKTLRRHFRYELDTGYVKANAKVVQSLYAQATGGNVTAAIWWTKARMGWAERVEHSGKDGGPMELRALLLEIDGKTRGLPRSNQLIESHDRPDVSSLCERTDPK